MRADLESSTHILVHAHEVLAKDEPDDLKLERLWHTLTSLRANLNAIVLRNTFGSKVLSGPFKGMQLTPAVMTKIFGPILTGHYEFELHGVMERVIAHPYKNILNIGCAFGYYAVGLALRMPQAHIHAFDIDPDERKKCVDLALLNGVQDRVKMGEEFTGANFAAYADGSTLAIVDIEGAETELLDLARYPALSKIDMIVEAHDVYRPGISKILAERFAATHDIETIYNRPSMFDFGSVLGADHFINPIDSTIIAWENRAGPTPWVILRAKK